MIFIIDGIMYVENIQRLNFKGKEKRRVLKYSSKLVINYQFGMPDRGAKCLMRGLSAND